jgi:hypothetical protein
MLTSLIILILTDIKKQPVANYFSIKHLLNGVLFHSSNSQLFLGFKGNSSIWYNVGSI